MKIHLYSDSYAYVNVLCVYGCVCCFVAVCEEITKCKSQIKAKINDCNNKKLHFRGKEKKRRIIFSIRKKHTHDDRACEWIKSQ